MRQRVFISGMGVVSCLGNDCSSFWKNAIHGRSGLQLIENIDVSDMPTKIGGEVRDLPLDKAVFGELSPKRLDRASQFAIKATHEALLDAGLSTADLGGNCGVILGSGLSGLMTLQTQTERLLNKGPRGVSPYTIPMLMPNAPAANVSLAFGVTGSCFTVGSACASSGHAIIEAAQQIQQGLVDIVITGGTEASLTRLGIAAFTNMKAMTKKYNDDPHRAMRPFDASRDGFVMSEGSAVVILESEASLRGRSGTRRAEFLGGGATSDAHHIVRPAEDGAGATRAIELALQQAGLSAAEIAGRTYINAHGTSTAYNDRIETRAIRRAFGQHAGDLQISSTKSVTGHMIGASAAIETVACVRALQTGVLPPTINYSQPDPDCDLDYIPNEARESAVEFAINNTLGFGGHNVSLVYGRGN